VRCDNTSCSPMGLVLGHFALIFILVMMTLTYGTNIIFKFVSQI
jgi:hypothetical protein